MHILLHHPHLPQILILKFLWFIEPLKLTILGGSLLFEIMGAWRILLYVRPDDLHGSLLVNAYASFMTFKCVFLDDLHRSRPS
ncbi:hypothetical protein IGI04_034470, partial [Brassica rapa subsp. trilocularis]